MAKVSGDSGGMLAPVGRDDASGRAKGRVGVFLAFFDAAHGRQLWKFQFPVESDWRKIDRNRVFLCIFVKKSVRNALIFVMQLGGCGGGQMATKSGAFDEKPCGSDVCADVVSHGT